MGGESFWLAGACNAVNFVFIPPDSHIRYTHRLIPTQWRFRHHRVPPTGLQSILYKHYHGQRDKCIPGGNVEEALITDKWFGEVGFSGIKRQCKMPEVVDEGPGSDVLVG